MDRSQNWLYAYAEEDLKTQAGIAPDGIYWFEWDPNRDSWSWHYFYGSDELNAMDSSWIEDHQEYFHPISSPLPLLKCAECSGNIWGDDYLCNMCRIAI